MLPLQDSHPGEGRTWTRPSHPAAGKLPGFADRSYPLPPCGSILGLFVLAVVKGRNASWLRLHLSMRERRSWLFLGCYWRRSAPEGSNQVTEEMDVFEFCA